MIDLKHGDCLKLMKDIPSNSIDCVLTDPPYGTTACKWDSVIPFEPMWEQLKRITKDNGAICLFGSEPFSSHLRLSNIKMFKYDWVWDKINGGAFATFKYKPNINFENIIIFGKGKIKYYPIMRDLNLDDAKRRKRVHNNLTKASDLFPSMCPTYSDAYKNAKKAYPKGIIQFKKEINNQYKKARFHPTQKPVALLEYLIKTYTLENETVLDFTMGSGSTGVACKNLSRKFIGIEKDDKYFEIAKSRIHENSRKN